jgi:hypothetical protein
MYYLLQVCLFDDFKDTEYLNIQNLVSSTSFKEFVDNVLVVFYINKLEILSI